MKLIANYQHSKHSNRGLPAIVGPRTFTNSARRWQVRLTMDLPFAHGAEKREVLRVIINTEVMMYHIAAMVAKDELSQAEQENPDWTDFTWQVWAI